MEQVSLNLLYSGVRELVCVRSSLASWIWVLLRMSSCICTNKRTCDVFHGRGIILAFSECVMDYNYRHGAILAEIRGQVLVRFLTVSRRQSWCGVSGEEWYLIWIRQLSSTGSSCIIKTFGINPKKILLLWICIRISAWCLNVSNRVSRRRWRQIVDRSPRRGFMLMSDELMKATCT